MEIITARIMLHFLWLTLDFYFGIAENNLVIYHRLTEHDNKMCQSGGVVFNKTDITELRCCWLCSRQPPCIGVFYKNETCTGCQAIQTKLDNHLGTIYLEVTWIPFQGSVYYFGNGKKMTHQEAQTHCQSLKANLVQVDDEQENTFLKDFLRKTKNDDYWMGLKNDVMDGKWRWSKTNNIATFLDWHKSQPDGFIQRQNEDCVAFFKKFDFQWGDSLCSREKQPVCEKRFTTPVMAKKNTF